MKALLYSEVLAQYRTMYISEIESLRTYDSLRSSGSSCRRVPNLHSERVFTEPEHENTEVQPATTRKAQRRHAASKLRRPAVKQFVGSAYIIPVGKTVGCR